MLDGRPCTPASPNRSYSSLCFSYCLHCHSYSPRGDSFSLHHDSYRSLYDSYRLHRDSYHSRGDSFSLHHDFYCSLYDSYRLHAIPTTCTEIPTGEGDTARDEGATALAA